VVIEGRQIPIRFAESSNKIHLKALRALKSQVLPANLGQGPGQLSLVGDLKKRRLCERDVNPASATNDPFHSTRLRVASV
jgi:hypothetical protein